VPITISEGMFVGAHMPYSTAPVHYRSGHARSCTSFWTPQEMQIERRSQDDTTAQCPFGLPEHTAVPLGGEQVLLDIEKSPQGWAKYPFYAFSTDG
jgi:hypothetical protein